MGCCAPVQSKKEDAFPILSPNETPYNRKNSLSNQLDRIIKKKVEETSPQIMFPAERPGSYNENEVQMKRISRVKLNTTIMQDKKVEVSSFAKRSKNSKRANTMNLGENMNFMSKEFPFEHRSKEQELQIILPLS